MFFKKEVVEQKKSEVAQTTENFKALFNESEVHKEIICNAIKDLISVNTKIDIEIETIDLLVKSLSELKIEYIDFKERNKSLLKELMPIMTKEANSETEK